MDDLGLTEFANKKISELSGGQKRRVSIGIELLSPSPYFILDEPSSGLDALSDRNLLRTLKILAKSANKSIVVITHNTENLAILTRLSSCLRDVRHLQEPMKSCFWNTRLAILI